jgi:hypothetical protein
VKSVPLAEALKSREWVTWSSHSARFAFSKQGRKGKHVEMSCDDHDNKEIVACVVGIKIPRVVVGDVWM